MRYTATCMPAFSAVRRQPVGRRSIELRRRHIRQVVALIFIVIVSAVLFVWTRIQVIQLGYEVSRLRKETADLVERKNSLEAEVATLKSPGRLEAAARDLFGMRLPLAGEVVYVGGNAKTENVEEKVFTDGSTVDVENSERLTTND